jgi:hypothetical protein
MVPHGRNGHHPRMIRRFVALALWTYFAWYLGAMLAAFTGGPAVAGPIAGVLTAAVGTYGWVRTSRRRAASPTTLEASPSR